MRVIEHLDKIETCVERILQRSGAHVVLAAPLGLGKPNRLLNELYRRICAEPARRLSIHTALSLDPPDPQSDIERRFAAPFLVRQFGPDYPRLDYVAAMRADRLPPNVRVHEFYFQSGQMLASRQAQRDYVSLNYTSVARDLLDVGLTVIVQLVARRGQGEAARYSLGCNPDVTLDLLDGLRARGGPMPLVVAVVHESMPYLGGDAEVGDGRGLFDLILDEEGADQRLFALPREDIDDVEYAIGLNASSLVRDGGTLQIGIGALSDALVDGLLLRQKRNAEYRGLLDALRFERTQAAVVERDGGLGPLAQGLHGASEMVMDGFMHLRRAGILTREVFDDLPLQRALNAGRVSVRLEAGDARHLLDAGVIPAVLDAQALPRLQRFGILPEECRVEGDALITAGGHGLGTNLRDPDALAEFDKLIRGRRLRGGCYLKGGFCLGSGELYDWLRGLEGEDWAGLAMNRISEVNQLQRGMEVLAAEQRRHARFFNTCMMATPLGAAVSDALDDGRLVSGVGGQYNFVALSDQLEGARSILMLRATRGEGSKAQSNIRWAYGHVTIPRHLRDIFVTEYGIADVRGKTDEECVLAMLAISDACFQPALVKAAIRARKLPAGFEIPPAWRLNTPEELARRLAPFRARGVISAYPFGSDFDAIELRLLPALQWLKRHAGSLRGRLRLLGAVLSPGQVDVEAIRRMGLDGPKSLRERALRRLLAGALNRSRAP